MTNVILDELLAASDLADADDAVRVVIGTGAGRAFCVGAHLAEGDRPFAAVETPDGSPARDRGGIAALRIFRGTKPVIGAIDGAAVGIGASMTLPMDVRVASEHANLDFVHVRRAVVPEGASVRDDVPADELLPARRLAAEGTSPVSVELTRQPLWRGLGEDHPVAAHRADSRAFPGRVSDGVPDLRPCSSEPGFA